MARKVFFVKIKKYKHGGTSTKDMEKERKRERKK